MGSPLAPVLTNNFIGSYKSKWLNEYILNKPRFYLKYANDILAAFDNKQDSLNFPNYLNNRHPNVKLTIQKQTQQTFFGLPEVLKTSSRHVLRTSSTCLQRNNFSSSETFWRRLAKMSWRHLAKHLEDIFKMSWKTKNCYA